MPSSKVIKAAAAAAPISDFSFRPVQRGGAAGELPPTDEGGSAFVPLEIFDPTELGGKISLSLPQKTADEQQPEIPGAFVSDEERERGLQESYQRGLQDGKNLTERGLCNVFRSLRTATEDLQQLREKLLRETEDDLLTLVIAVSRRVINQEVAQDRQVILRVIRAALRDLGSQDELVIRLHPDDQALLSTSQDQPLQRELAAFRATLKGDATIQPGCCLVETALGTVDATFEAQLGEIYRQLLEERASAAPFTKPAVTG